jgi:hypothetical protein
VITKKLQGEQNNSSHGGSEQKTEVKHPYATNSKQQSEMELSFVQELGDAKNKTSNNTAVFFDGWTNKDRSQQNYMSQMDTFQKMNPSGEKSINTSQNVLEGNSSKHPYDGNVVPPLSQSFSVKKSNIRKEKEHNVCGPNLLKNILDR